MKYTKRRLWKYKLHSEEVVQTTIKPDALIITEFIQLDYNGELKIFAGYCWDGPSGPVLHRPDNMRGTLVHDALYQLMRENHLPQSERQQADEMLRSICLEDGMSPFWANLFYNTVRKHGAKAAQSNVQEAPLKK